MRGKRMLWRILGAGVDGHSLWVWRHWGERSPCGCWAVVRTKWRGKWHSSMIDEIFGYATIGDSATLPIYPADSATEERYPTPPCYCSLCQCCHEVPCAG